MYPSDVMPKLVVRLPVEVKAFIEVQAARNGSSQNSEIIRCIRERMDRQKSEWADAATSTHSSPESKSLSGDTDNGSEG